MIWPGIFYIETVLGCNLKCPECPMGNNSIIRKKHIMSFERYKILADKIKPYARTVYPFIWGEPLLNPDIIDIVAYTKKFARVYLSTNANLITREMAKNLMAQKPDVIDVPLDAATEETYQIVRKGGSLKKAIQGIRFLQEYRNDTTVVRGQFVVFQHNQHELPAFKKLCNDLQVPTRINKPLIFNKNLAPSTNSIHRRPVYHSMATVRQDIKSCEARIRMVIQVDGNVVPCCFDYNSNLIFGNLFEQTVPQIWESSKYKVFRMKLTGKKPNPPAFCLTCPRFTLGPRIKKKLRQQKLI
jgi:radical SAM protein with 4Fe4S-binding SPASM domain